MNPSYAVRIEIDEPPKMVSWEWFYGNFVKGEITFDAKGRVSIDREAFDVDATGWTKLKDGKYEIIVRRLS